MEETKYTYEDLLLALNSMDEEKKHLLLKSVKISDLFEMMNSEEKFENAMKKRRSVCCVVSTYTGVFNESKRKIRIGRFYFKQRD